MKLVQMVALNRVSNLVYCGAPLTYYLTLFASGFSVTKKWGYHAVD